MAGSRLGTIQRVRFLAPVGDRTLQSWSLRPRQPRHRPPASPAHSLVGWITISAPRSLLPLIAIPGRPASQAWRPDQHHNLPTMLFAIPSGLALVVLGAQIAKDGSKF